MIWTQIKLYAKDPLYAQEIGYIYLIVKLHAQETKINILQQLPNIYRYNKTTSCPGGKIKSDDINPLHAQEARLI